MLDQETIKLDLGKGEQEYTLTRNIRTDGYVLDFAADFFGSREAFSDYYRKALAGEQTLFGDMCAFAALVLYCRLLPKHPDLKPNDVLEGVEPGRVLDMVNQALADLNEKTDPDPEHETPKGETDKEAEAETLADPTAPVAKPGSKRSASLRRASGSRKKKRSA